MNPEINKHIVCQVNKAWGWKSVSACEIIDINQFGNIIFRSDKDGIYRICPEELSMNKIADNKKEYDLLKLKTEFRIDWEMNSLVEIAKAKIGELKEKEKILP